MQLPKHKIDSLRAKLRNLEKIGKEIVFDVTFLRGNEKDKLIEHSNIKGLIQINKLLNYEDYEQLKLDIYDLKVSSTKPHSSERILLQNQTKKDELGELEQSKFEKFLQEREKEQAFTQMKEELGELETENKSLEETVEELQQQVEQLQNQINNKNNFKHYAGILGEILGKIGVKSEKLNAVTGLFGIDDFQSVHETAPALAEATDTSGIVEHKSEKTETTEESQPIQPEDQKKIELIQLMVDFLYNLDVKTLGLVFAIFSEVEQQPALAKHILLFINQDSQPHPNPPQRGETELTNN